MKILAIRGKNLASLSAEFVVDFESEPLASAGLYAITGPTGSGKSTLLDALCLALYERTPRLAKATAKGETIPDVGDYDVSPSDPRTILRRGASEGFAEVDFVGSDGVAFRARWSARRARVKADGKLQASDMSLTRITDGQRLGDHTKTETLRLIEACIGLSFEQFTRAVLLAQNDFATFLKAPDDERAELLQTLTGTETFSHISKQAYARMKAENDALALLHQQLQGQQALAPEARAEKDSDLQTLTANAQVLEAHKAAIEGHLRWYQLQAEHQQAVQESSVVCAAALAEQQAAAPRHELLHRVEQVQSARGLWTDVQRLTQSAMAAVQLQADVAARLTQAQQLAHSSQSAHAAAHETAAHADAASALAQPAIAQARALDASMLALAPEFQAAAQAQAEAQAHLDAQTAQQAATAAHSAATQDQLHSTEEWLQRHAPLRALSEGWQRWETLFANAQALRSSQEQGQAEAQNFANQAAANTVQQGAAQTSLEQAAATANAAAEQLDQWVQACATVDADSLAESKKAMEEQRDHLQAAALLWHKRSDVRGQRLRLQEQQSAHSSTLAESEQTLEECTLSLPLLGSALQSAEQALQLAILAASGDAKTLRAQLLPDAACPVCGALEHPYAQHAPALNAVLQGLHDHVTQQRQALQQVLARQAVATASKLSAAKALEQGQRELLQLAAQRDLLLQDWAALALQAELDAVPEAERSDWLQQHQDQARQALTRFNEQDEQHRQNLRRKDAAQLARNSAAQTLEQAKEALARLTASGQQIVQAQEATQRQLSALDQQLQATLAQLDSAFTDANANANADWRQRWSAAPDAFVAQCRSDAQAWAAQHAEHASLSQRIAALQLQLAAQSGACAQATQQLATQTARHQSVAATLQSHRSTRSALLEGRSVAEVEARLSADIQEARAALDAAQSAMQTAQADVTRLSESLRLAAQQQEHEHTALALAQTALDQWLEHFNAQLQDMAPPTERADMQRSDVAKPVAKPCSDASQPAGRLDSAALQSLLAIDTAWITQERAALQALQNAVTTAQAVRDTRSQLLMAHQANQQTPDSEPALQAQLLQAHADIASLLENLSALKLDIARDDERLAASSALRLHIAQQSSAAKVWSQLGELIGSADGKKFRNFAQQLTLDILLGYGNSHLRSLTSRYRLERIQDSLGLLVVDQDMGDEVRSVHSLSGGESFLVSLAMALGLASLSSHRVRVESLFIDEGFGSLDADYLRVAMDALDSLQSLGRKVGVISHVQEMTERIGTRVQVQRQAGGLSRVVVS